VEEFKKLLRRKKGINADKAVTETFSTVSNTVASNQSQKYFPSGIKSPHAPDNAIVE